MNKYVVLADAHCTHYLQKSACHTFHVASAIPRVPFKTRNCRNARLRNKFSTAFTPTEVYTKSYFASIVYSIQIKVPRHPFAVPHNSRCKTCSPTRRLRGRPVRSAFPVMGRTGRRLERSWSFSATPCSVCCPSDTIVLPIVSTMYLVDNIYRKTTESGE